MNLHTLLILYAELAVLWWMYAWLYYGYRTDLLRFRLFIIRDRLFDAAVKGDLDFNSPAYKRTRTTLNGALRFAHRLTLSKLLITALWMHRKDPTAVERQHKAMRLAMQGLTRDQKRLLLDAQEEICVVMLTHVAHVSLPLFPLVMLFTFGLRLHWWRESWVKRRTFNGMKAIEAYAFDLGNQDDGLYAH
jgi:hypothetical protein